jgi:dihydroflavonol-4-reductase
MNTVLVTGASGFIGRFLILSLLKKGDTVFALLRKPENQLPELREWLKKYGVTQSSRLLPIYGDLSQPDLAIGEEDWRAMQSVQIIYNCGGLYAWRMNAAQARQVNLHGAIRLLELGSQRLRLDRFVHVSGYMLSIQSHLNKLGINSDGEHDDWDSVYRQVGAYEASKIEAHFAVKRTARLLQVPLTVAHPAGVIGHSTTGEISLSQDVAKTMIKLLRGKLPAVPRGFLPMIGVDELADFMAYVVDYPESTDQEYVLANSDQIDLKTALTLCAQTVHARIPFLSISVATLGMIAKSNFLARLFDIEKETLNFIQAGPIDIQATREMRRKMGLPEASLKRSLSKTAYFIHQNLSAAD